MYEEGGRFSDPSLRKLEQADVAVLEKNDVILLLDFLLEKRITELNITLDAATREKIRTAFINTELVFDINQIEAFKSGSEVSKFAQKLAAKTITGGSVATYFNSDRSLVFQVFINTGNLLSDPNQKLLHELTHVVDFVLAREFPATLENNGERANDINFFLSKSIPAFCAYALCNLAIMSSNVVPYQIENLAMLATTVALVLRLQKSIEPYTNDPKEVRARANEKLIKNRFSRGIESMMTGLNINRGE